MYYGTLGSCLNPPEKADILLIECMAVNPELQYVCEHQILEADVTVITNVRLDHVQDMGENLEDIAYAFCNTIPTNGHLVVNDSEYVKLFKEKAKELGTTVHVAKPYENEDTLDTFAENIAVALEVARVLNLDLEIPLPVSETSIQTFLSLSSIFNVISPSPKTAA